MLPVLATLAVVPFVAVLANFVYNNRWYLEYRWAKYKMKRKRKRKRRGRWGKRNWRKFIHFQ